MAKDNTRYPEPSEVVGSADLRESFKKSDRIRGSFFINGIEMHQFDANSPASVVSQINAKTSGHFVTAEVDDGGHLVLIDPSGAPISVHAGAAFNEPEPATTGDAAKDVLRSLKHAERNDKDKDKEKHGVLDLLGLKDTEEKTEAEVARPGFETGRSANDRRKQWEDADPSKPQANPNQRANPNQPARQGSLTSGPQIPSNPTPGGSGAAGGQMADGRGRTGTGGGQGETSANTIQRSSEHKLSEAPVPGA